MPTYQYACTDCGHRFEAVQAFSDGSLTVCPECGGKLRKVYGSVGVVFKGSGFYRNDARNGASGNGKKDGGASSGDGAATTSGDSGGTKKDSAPAAASDSGSAGSGSTSKDKAPSTSTSAASTSTKAATG